MLDDIFFALWFLLPPAFANAAPIFAAHIPYLNKWQAPLDGGRTYRGKEIFGSHKTWRGMASGIVVATLFLWLEQLAAVNFAWAHDIAGNINYTVLPTLLLGPLFGIGALGGDAVESFFKRARGIKPGRHWIPFDQVDYIVGGILVSLPFFVLSPVLYVWTFVIWFIIHIAASYIGWLIGLKKHPI